MGNLKKGGGMLAHEFFPPLLLGLEVYLLSDLVRYDLSAFKEGGTLNLNNRDFKCR